eukprot:GILK01006216.1.p1 GENE.GILK01006216.1~~GILK01006216.1.p1  ORF type:complete len:512 (-),score=66.49 GILK01006216.1:125-1594(-)
MAESSIRTKVQVLGIPHLSEWVPDLQQYDTPLLYRDSTDSDQSNGFICPEGFPPDDEIALSTNVFHMSQIEEEMALTRGYVRCGPRRKVVFEPKKVKAAIVTCGGLCPGLNAVIRDIVMTLSCNYGCDEIYGIPYGYGGFYMEQHRRLTPEDVQDIHQLGGTMLGTSRGGFDEEKILDSIEQHGYNQVFVIGGDGTHRGLITLFEASRRRKMRVSLVGVPKTIDNDLPLIDKSFGLDTAVEEAQRAIGSAYVEARSAKNGIGLVKLMGRSAGFIAMLASLASREVDICLIPEINWQINGPDGLLEYVKRMLPVRKHAVIVVAEGAGQGLVDERLDNRGVDASGNVKFADIGRYVYDRINQFSKENGLDITLKYLDPTYMIRSVAASATDRIYCSILAQNAVHGAMCGYTGFSIGRVNQRYVFLPLPEIVRISRRVDPKSRMWHRLLASTRQPTFLSNGGKQTQTEPVQLRPDVINRQTGTAYAFLTQNI